MIGPKAGPIESLIVALVRLPITLGARAFKRRPQVVEAPKPDLWASLTTDDQRAVISALIKLGRPAKNVELAKAMGVSPGEASKRRQSLNGSLKTERIGRDVWISLE